MQSDKARHLTTYISITRDWQQVTVADIDLPNKLLLHSQTKLLSVQCLRFINNDVEGMVAATLARKWALELSVFVPNSFSIKGFGGSEPSWSCYELIFMPYDYGNQWGVNFDVKFGFNYNDSTSWEVISRCVCDFLRKSSYTIKWHALFNISLNISERLAKTNINSPRWALHLTLSSSHNE